VTVTGLGNVVLTPESSDLIGGTFTFAVDPGSVQVTGWVYDVMEAAALVAEEWAAKYARTTDYSGDGRSVHRTQQRDGLRQLAKDLRARSKPWAIPLGGRSMETEEVVGWPIH
jgi:hypothetical protein